jgi:hypothetical protein
MAGGPAVRTVQRGRDASALGCLVAEWLLAHGADAILAAIDRADRLAAPEPK